MSCLHADTDTRIDAFTHIHMCNLILRVYSNVCLYIWIYVLSLCAFNVYIDVLSDANTAEYIAYSCNSCLMSPGAAGSHVAAETVVSELV